MEGLRNLVAPRRDSRGVVSRAHRECRYGLGWRTIGLLLVCLASVVPAWAASEFSSGAIVETVSTLHDPVQEYALYLPNSYPGGDGQVFPVLFVLDPRGRAVPGIERFLPAAERHGFIVVSSYRSRSDTWASVTSDALAALLRDAEVRFRMNKRRLYLAGMSGTSHAAWRLAQQLGEHVAGVIGCAGGVQEETQGPPGTADFAYYGVTSNADFNYREVLQLERHMRKAEIDHRIEIFEGLHGWPPPEYTNRALDWMQFQAVKRGLAPLDESLIEAAFRWAKTAAESTPDPLEESRRRRDVIRDFDGLRDVTEDERLLLGIETSAAFKARRDQERKLAKQEEAYYRRRLAAWLASMQDLERPTPTIEAARKALDLDRLLSAAADEGNSPESGSAKRVLDSVYTTVAFSLPGTFRQTGNDERAARSLEVAVAIYPQRPRAHWSLAAAYVRGGDHSRALEALHRAADFGRVDLNRLRTDPTWEPLRGDREWAELVASIERAQAAGSGS